MRLKTKLSVFCLLLLVASIAWFLEAESSSTTATPALVPHATAALGTDAAELQEDNTAASGPPSRPEPGSPAYTQLRTTARLIAGERWLRREWDRHVMAVRLSYETEWKEHVSAFHQRFASQIKQLGDDGRTSWLPAADGTVRYETHSQAGVVWQQHQKLFESRLAEAANSFRSWLPGSPHTAISVQTVLEWETASPDAATRLAGLRELALILHKSPPEELLAAVPLR